MKNKSLRQMILTREESAELRANVNRARLARKQGNPAKSNWLSIQNQHIIDKAVARFKKAQAAEQVELSSPHPTPKDP